MQLGHGYVTADGYCLAVSTRQLILAVRGGAVRNTICSFTLSAVRKDHTVWTSSMCRATWKNKISIEI
eukprot:2760853-Amphidinium_carterae.1